MKYFYLIFIFLFSFPILSNEIGLKNFDINKYMKSSNLFTEDSNLINNYFVKPEFIVKLIEKDLLS